METRALNRLVMRAGEADGRKADADADGECCCESETDSEDDVGPVKDPELGADGARKRCACLVRVCRLIGAAYGTFQRRVKALVEHKYFQQGLLGAILINTLSMGIEYHNQVPLSIEFNLMTFKM